MELSVIHRRRPALAQRSTIINIPIFFITTTNNHSPSEATPQLTASASQGGNCGWCEATRFTVAIKQLHEGFLTSSPPVKQKTHMSTITGTGLIIPAGNMWAHQQGDDFGIGERHAVLRNHGQVSKHVGRTHAVSEPVCGCLLVHQSSVLFPPPPLSATTASAIVHLVLPADAGTKHQHAPCHPYTGHLHAQTRTQTHT
jgi:hypothetical protein